MKLPTWNWWEKHDQYRLDIPGLVKTRVATMDAILKHMTGGKT